MWAASGPSMNALRLLVVSVVALFTACGVPEEPLPEERASTQDALTLPPLIQLPSAPTISSLSPSIGLPGTLVTLNGVNFVNLAPNSLASIYRFENDTTPLQVTVISDTRARFTVPSTSRGGRVCRSSILSATPTSCTSNAFVVGDPNGRVRLDNRTRAELISARFNSREVLAPQTVASGTTHDIAPVTPGNYGWELAVGFGPFAGPAANRVICSINGTMSVPANTTTPLWVADLTVPDLLGHCGTVSYVANYLDDRGLPRQVTMRFEPAGSRWVYLEGNTVLGSGQVTAVVWNPGSPFVTFRLNGSGWSDVVIGYPYAIFNAGPSGQVLAFTRVGNW